MAQESINKVITPDEHELRKLTLEIERASKEKELDMGKIGAFFGSRDNAVIYIAAAVIVLSMIGGALMVLPDTLSPARADMAKAFGALAFSALGYMFGSISSRHHSE